jgi:SAM-dependent methyltransferase
MTGIYKYPWRSEFDEPLAEAILAEQIAGYIHEQSYVLDVGCGHGEFTKSLAYLAQAIVGIDVNERYIATANEAKLPSVTFQVVDADQPLPFADQSFDIIYSKKGPWLFHEGMVEGHRLLKPGGMALGLYHCGTDGGLRALFPGLYEPLPDNHLEETRNKFEHQLSASKLGQTELHLIEEVEYLSRPEDILIKKCFGQKESLQQLVWQLCLKDVEDIFHQHATARGFKVINYHVLLVGQACLCPS